MTTRRGPDRRPAGPRDHPEPVPPYSPAWARRPPCTGATRTTRGSSRATTTLQQRPTTRASRRTGSGLLLAKMPDGRSRQLPQLRRAVVAYAVSFGDLEPALVTEQIQMCHGFADREHLVERLQFGEASFAPGPS